jgi:mannose-1-phosphate guanylyltransferase
MRHAVIMAGGSGLRLWPLSRSSRPKQLLKLVDGRSLLQLTWDRIAGLLPAGQIFVCTAESDADAVLAELPDTCRRTTCCASPSAVTPPTPSGSRPRCFASGTHKRSSPS